MWGRVVILSLLFYAGEEMRLCWEASTPCARLGKAIVWGGRAGGRGGPVGRRRRVAILEGHACRCWLPHRGIAWPLQRAPVLLLGSGVAGECDLGSGASGSVTGVERRRREPPGRDGGRLGRAGRVLGDGERKAQGRKQRV